MRGGSEHCDRASKDTDIDNPPWIGKKLVGKRIQVGYPDDASKDPETTWWDVDVQGFNAKTKLHTVKGETDGGEFLSTVDLHDTFWRYTGYLENSKQN